MFLYARHVRVERVVLEDHRDVAVLRREVVHDLAADANDAVADRLEPGDHPQRARLPAARRADEDDELAVADLEVEVADRVRPVRIDLVQLLQRDLGHGAQFFIRHRSRCRHSGCTGSARDIRLK